MGPCLSIGAKRSRPGKRKAVNPRYGSQLGMRRNDMNASGEKGEVLQHPELKMFRFSELKAATLDFNQNNVVDQGGYGPVFKAWINLDTLTAASPETGMLVAVKMLDQNGSQDLQEWLTEIKQQAPLCHPNIVKLIGYCLENAHWLLVYEYMPNGSLENHLFTRGNLSWEQRIEIAVGAARGLAFLHNQANVVFRDFHTSNILLDLNFNAKLSHFGLTKDGPVDAKSHITTRVLGIEWYLAPEYINTGHLRKSGDVYSYGVVLLEVLSGRRAMEMNMETPERNLVKWAKPWLNHKRKFLNVVDPRLDRQFSSSDVLKAGQLAYQCLSSDPNQRPKMDAVVKALEQLASSLPSERDTSAF